MWCSLWFRQRIVNRLAYSALRRVSMSTLLLGVVGAIISLLLGALAQCADE